MRDTADPDVQDAPPAAPHPEVDRPAEHATAPTEPEPEPVAQDDDPQPARIVPGPLIAMSAETVTAAGAALWTVGGWMAVGLGAGALAGAGAAAVAGRRRSSGAWRTRSWSTSSGWRSPGRPGSSGRMPRVGSSAGRARSRMPSLGGAGGAGARRGAGASPGRGTRAGSRSAGFPGAGKRAAAGGKALQGVGNTARTARRAGSGALDRAAAGALRGRAASRAARQALREGGGPRAASRAARGSALGVETRGAWRRTLGSAGWGLAGWGLGLLYAGGRLVLRAIRHVFHLRHPDTEDHAGEERPRIKTTVDRPTTPAAGTTDTRGATMAGGGAPSFVAAAEELGAAFAKYEPPPGPGGMVKMLADVGMLPDALDQIQIGLNVLATRCRHELPLHDAIAEIVHELAKVQSQMANVAGEIKPAIRKLHEKDLERHEAPRPQETLWDVG